MAELELETKSLGLCSPYDSRFSPREIRPGIGGHLTGIRTRHNCGDNRGHWICLSLWVSISSFTAWDQSLCSLPAEGTLLSLKETRTPQSGREYIRAAELDSEEVESQECAGISESGTPQTVGAPGSDLGF